MHAEIADTVENHGRKRKKRSCHQAVGWAGVLAKNAITGPEHEANGGEGKEQAHDSAFDHGLDEFVVGVSEGKLAEFLRDVSPMERLDERESAKAGPEQRKLAKQGQAAGPQGRSGFEPATLPKRFEPILYDAHAKPREQRKAAGAANQNPEGCTGKPKHGPSPNEHSKQADDQKHHDSAARQAKHHCAKHERQPGPNPKRFRLK